MFKCYSVQLHFWENAFLGICPTGKCISGQMFLWANCLMGRRLVGKYLSGQVSVSANVYGQKCIWADVVLANVIEPLGTCQEILT
jgi:hypothetical protein